MCDHTRARIKQALLSLLCYRICTVRHIKKIIYGIPKHNLFGVSVRIGGMLINCIPRCSYICFILATCTSLSFTYAYISAPITLKDTHGNISFSNTIMIFFLKFKYSVHTCIIFCLQ